MSARKLEEETEDFHGAPRLYCVYCRSCSCQCAVQFGIATSLPAKHHFASTHAVTSMYIKRSEKNPER
jgi:hypothetical protein